MSNDDLVSVVLDTLGTIAPDLDPATIGLDDDFQDDLGLDSMDSLNLVVALHERTGVEIPERELPRVRTVHQLAAYLAAHSPA